MGSYITPTLQRKTETEVFKKVVRLTSQSSWRELSYPWFTNGERDKRFDWNGDWGAARRWIGARKLDSTIQHNRSLDSEDFEKATAWNRFDMMDKLLWNFAKKNVMGLTDVWAELPEILLLEKLTSTTDTLTKDGVTFFSDYHPIDLRPGVFNSNVISQTGITAANIIVDFDSFIVALHALERRDGRKIYQNAKNLKFKIKHSPDLASVMKHVFKKIDSGLSETQGYHSGYDVELETDGNLTGNEYYIFIMNVPIKPFIYMEVVKPIWEYDETFQFSDNEIRYGVSGRHKMHYGYWECVFVVRP